MSMIQTLMDSNTRRNRMCRQKNYSLVVLALCLLQHYLHVSVTFVNATSEVSVLRIFQVLAPFPFFFSFFGHWFLTKECFQVHIVYLGEKKYDDPALTKKFHHKMLTTLLGRYGFILHYSFF